MSRRNRSGRAERGEAERSVRSVRSTRRRERAKEHGQATVELALGSLVFVTLIMFGVHFGELGIAMLKVKEAEHFAAFDVAAHRTDAFNVADVSSGSTFALFDPPPVGTAAKARYRDLDGMSDASLPGWTQAVTRLDRFDLTCERDQTLRFRTLLVAPIRPEANAAHAWLQGRYRDEGGASCRAEAHVSAFRIPEAFAEGGNGLFQARHRALLDIPVCGSGFASGGACTGKLTVLTGDWAFDAPGANAGSTNEDVVSTEWPSVTNKAYRDMVQNIFDLNGGPLADNTGTAAQHLMEVGANVGPNDQPEYENETRFSMSYESDENETQPTVPPHQLRTPVSGRIVYQTSGADLHSDYVKWSETTGVISGVPRCFLGVNGCQYPRGR